MSEPKLISPMLDNFAMGDPISEHNGVRCCPAMENDSDNKYIVKIISTPASQTQLDALLLSGAYPDKDAAMLYFKTLADSIIEEALVLQKLSQLEGFLPFENWQVEPMEDANGYDVYLLSTYRKTLQRHFQRSPMTHLGALNLGLDLCAALAVCRRLGYLYVDLKPENVYLTADNEYRIGDLGFLKLDSLKYASLPDRYRSVYTAPEITDAYSALNTTLDVYAMGLILYQAFNDGALPAVSEEAEAGQFPPPAYADYEMAEIILKACAQEPADRWQDPIEMGQALVSYMQRNGAHDTPIVPQAVQEDTPVEEEVGAFEDVDGEGTTPADEETTSEDAESSECAVSSDITPEEITEEDIYTEDEQGNLTFIVDDAGDETAPNEEQAEIAYEEVSEELSDILNQADELIAHPAPDPVVQPEPIEVTVPPVSEDETPEEDTDEVAASDDEASESATQETQDADTEESPAAEMPEDNVDEDNEPTEPDAGETDTEQPVVKKRSAMVWIRNVILVVAALAILAAGVFYYKNYYLQPIESILLEDGDKGVLTVFVSSQIDESKLTVVCLDTYGNQLTAPVENGKAVFTGLASNSAYTVKVVIEGFHRLTGDTSAAFTTPEETNIVQFQAVTGSEDGSVILGFTIEGPDANQWIIRYSCAQEEEKEVSFTGHMVTLNGLTIGNEYTFSLVPDSDLLITGIDKVVHTASKIVKAENLFITGCIDGKLTAEWSSPADASVESWTVRCYSDTNYDKTIVVTEPSAVFEGIDPAVGYTVEVTAAGMSVSERAFAAANSITVTDFTLDSSDPNKFVLSWNAATQSNWTLLYSLDGSANHEISCDSENSVTVDAVVPGAEYKFTLQSADGTAVLGGNMLYRSADARKFSGYGLSADYMEFKMCRTPSHKNWDRYDLSSSDYTTKFQAGEDASFLVRMRHEYDVSSDKIVTLYVIRDTDGNIVSAATTSATWSSMWRKNYGEFDIPELPQTPGEYSVSVYFNGELANTQTFTIVE